MNSFNNICLLCLSHNKNIKNVLTNDDDGILVEQKLKYILPEENITLWYNKIVTFEPHTPKYICIDCLNDLNHVYKFKQKCFKSLKSLSDYILEEAIEQLKHQNEYGILPDNITNDIVHSTVVQDRIVYVVDEVEEYTKEENIVIKTELEYIQDNTDYLEEKTQTNRNNLGEEIHTNINNLVEVIVKGEPAELHEEIDIKEDPLLPEETYTEDVLDNETTVNAGDTSTSATGEKNKKPHKYKCIECHASFPSSSKLFTHKLTHNKKKPFKCDVCHKAFNKKFFLIIHQRTHTGERPFKCEICDKTFRSQVYMTTHRRIHTGERPFKCDQCDKAFSQQTSLTYHKRIHSGEKPFQCDLCSFSCATGVRLNKHIRGHAAEDARKDQ